jgi:hypothetical protein
MNWQNNEDELKRTIDSYEFAYNEGDWLAAKALLQSRKRKRRAVIWLAASLFVIAGGAAVWMFSSPATTAVSQNGSQTQQPNTNAPINNNSLGDDNAATHVNPNSTQNTNTPLAEQQANNNPTETINLSPITPPGTRAITQSNSTDNRQVQGDDLGDTDIPNTITPQPQNGTQGQQPAQQGTSTQNTETATNAPTANEPQTPLADNNLATTNEQASQPPVADETPGQTDENKKTTASPKKPKPPRIKNSIALVVGGNYGTQNSLTNAPYFGIQYNRHLKNPDWILTAGLAYTVLNTNGFNKEFSGKQHGFGVTQTQINISTNRLQYLEMPLFAKYSYNTRFNFMGGLNVGYLLNTTNTIQETTYNTLTGITQTGTRSATTYKRGISAFDVQLQLGAEVALRQRLWLGFWANTGLLDVGCNRYYNNTVFERNMRLQLYIRYDVFKF